MIGQRAIEIAEEKVRLQESDNFVAQWLQALKDNEEGKYVSPGPRRSATPKRKSRTLFSTPKTPKS